MTEASERLAKKLKVADPVPPGKLLDPELMYVECSLCGEPVIWGPGRTTDIIMSAEIELSRLDDQCMIISHGCPKCAGDEVFYETRIVRVSDIMLPDMNFLYGVAGTA